MQLRSPFLASIDMGFKSSRHFKKFPKYRHPEAFTLVELLVAAVVSSITVVTAMLVLGPHLSANQRMEGYARLQERWIRFNYLFDTEVQRASNVGTTATSVTLDIPVTFPNGSVVNAQVIYRLNSTGDKILRDGPQIYPSGDLVGTDLSVTTLQTVSAQTVIDGITANGFSAQLVPNSGNMSLEYSLNLRDPNSDATYRGKGSVARGRADCASIESDGGPCN